MQDPVGTSGRSFQLSPSQEKGKSRNRPRHDKVPALCPSTAARASLGDGHSTFHAHKLTCPEPMLCVQSCAVPTAVVLAGRCIPTCAGAEPSRRWFVWCGASVSQTAIYLRSNTKMPFREGMETITAYCQASTSVPGRKAPIGLPIGEGSE